jgi:aryl-alcohol dehydrogenase-like predicted oxidoreductase
MMKYYLLGKSGLRVSEVALGAMSFGTEWGWGADINEARKMLDLYIDRGGNFVDTANLYTNGSSEKMLGELLGVYMMSPPAPSLPSIYREALPVSRIP